MKRKGKPNSGGLQETMFPPETSWTLPNMGDLPDWTGARRVCIDAETHDEHLRELGIGTRRGGESVGWSFTLDDADGPTFYLPYGHQGGDNLPKANVLRYLKAQAKNFKGEVVGANLSYDLDYWAEDGLEFPLVEFFRDIQIADPLIYEEHYSYSLKAIAERYGVQGKNEDLLQEAARQYGVHPKSGLWKLPARFVGDYAEEDTRSPLRVLDEQLKIIDRDDLQGVWDLESQVLPVLVKMRRRGILIDQDQLEKVENWSLEQEGEALDEVHRLSGVRVKVGDVWAGRVLAPVFDALGIKYGLTSKGDPSIDQDLFKNCGHAVGKHLGRARKVNKLRTTFASSIRTYMTNGRIHTTLNQIARMTESGNQKGARYGRLSSVHPNLQQQPSRDEFANMWRAVYLPEPGRLWCSADYSQQEPRWTTHFAAVCKLTGAAEAAQAYHDDPNIDNHDFMTELVFDIEKDKTKEFDAGFDKFRKRAKAIYLGLCYGEGGAKLCDDLGLPTRWAVKASWNEDIVYFDSQREALDERMKFKRGRIWRAAGLEGQGILNKFNDRAPFIKELAEATTGTAEDRGYIMTELGRRLHFPEKPEGGFDFVYRSLNRLIQGQSADQMKKALVTIDSAGYFLQLQIHDEVAASVANRKEGEEIAEIMSQATRGRVPFKVDLELGESWGQAV